MNAMSNGTEEDNPVGSTTTTKGASSAKDMPQVGDVSRGDGDTTPEQSADNIPTTVVDDHKNGETAPQISNNQSLRNLLQYDSDSSTSSEMELNMRWPTVHESDQSSTSPEDEDDDDDDDDESDEDDISVIDTTPQSKGAIKKQTNIGNHNLTPKKLEVEEGIDKLEPVPDLSTLNINSDEEIFVHMGNVLGVVDRLVTIGALPEIPAYDLNTLLFLDEGKRPLGFVFDVLGQVRSPIYAVRFNSVEDIKNLQIANGTKVYAAPNNKHTKYVFLTELLHKKGTDASWYGDQETPEEFLDYSDDENEYNATNKVMSAARAARSLNGAYASFADAAKRSAAGSDGVGGGGGSSSDSHKRFENTMNKRNLINTKFNNYIDSYKQARRRQAMQRHSANGGGGRRGGGGAPPQIPIAPSAGAAAAAAALLPPAFDPTVPPPNMFSPPTFYPVTTPPVAHMVGPYHHQHHHNMPFAVPSPFRHSPSPSSSSSTATSPYSSPQTGVYTPPSHYFVHDYLNSRSPVGGDNNNTRRLPPPPSSASTASLPPSFAAAPAPVGYIPGNFINPAMLALNQSPSLSLLSPPPPHQPSVMLPQQAPPPEPTNFAVAAPPPRAGGAATAEFPPAGSSSHQ